MTVVGENPTPYGVLALWAVNGLSIVCWALMAGLVNLMTPDDPQSFVLYAGKQEIFACPKYSQMLRKFSMFDNLLILKFPVAKMLDP